MPWTCCAYSSVQLIRPSIPAQQCIHLYSWFLQLSWPLPGPIPWQPGAMRTARRMIPTDPPRTRLTAESLRIHSPDPGRETSSHGSGHTSATNAELPAYPVLKPAPVRVSEPAPHRAPRVESDTASSITLNPDPRGRLRSGASHAIEKTPGPSFYRPSPVSSLPPRSDVTGPREHHLPSPPSAELAEYVKTHNRGW